MGFKFFVMRNLIAALLLTLSFGSVYGQTNELGKLVVIGNRTELTSIKKNTAINIFKGRLNSWNNGVVVVLVLPSQKNENAAEVAKVIYGTSVKGMQKFWLSLVFQGRSNPPVFLDSDEEIVKYVLRNPGSIGLINNTSQYPVNIEIETTK